MNLLKRAGKATLRIICTWLVRRQCGGCSGPITANYPSRVTARTFLGRNVHFNGLRIKGAGRVTISDNFHSGQEILFITEYHDYDGGNALPYDPVKTVCKDITIAANVWLGDRVVVLGGVSIGEGAIIQAGSVVVSDIPPCAIAGGHPAKVFKHRDRTHYEALKAAGRFI